MTTTVAARDVKMRSVCLAVLGCIVCLVVAWPGRAEVPTQEDLPPAQQIKLTKAMIESVLAAQDRLDQFTEKLADQDADLTAAQKQELDDIARQFSFKDFAALDDVTATISLVLASLDPETGSFTEPQVLLEEELREVRQDPDLEVEEREVLLAELTAAIAAGPKIEHPENIELVRQFQKQLLGALQ